ncbi:hypothetical protein RhiirC2_786190 [Rhizophagus irregularis]|uniref:Uncharacterized protein n=1 Tax=Rhizophagus irregularis TaxID=588596 RepID=A0A2N1MUY5_9GLOM|nr:hypothetical protein RhiirC2_786190 [Rhizophagus irregularis]
MNLSIILVFVLSLLFVTGSQSLTSRQIIPSPFTVEKVGKNKLAATVKWDGVDNNDTSIDVDNAFQNPVFSDRKVTFDLTIYISSVAVTCKCDMDTNPNLDPDERWTPNFGFETP